MGGDNGACRRQGFRLQRHVEALKAEAKLFTKANCAKVTLQPGLTVEYALHTTASVRSATTKTDEEEHVVLIMGLAMTKESWVCLVHQLLQCWPHDRALKVVTFDNRGIGGTQAGWEYKTSRMAMDTLALMDHLGWQDAHIVGASMGGMISLELASIAPARVKSLSLLVTSRGRFINTGAQLDMTRVAISRDPHVIIHSLMALLYPSEFLEQEMEDHDGKAHDALLEFHQQMHNSEHMLPRRISILGQVSAIWRHYVSDERLAAIAAVGFPILILTGRHDRLIPASESELLQQLLQGPHVKTVIFEDAGHGVFIQYMDEVVAELLANFQQSRSQ